MLVLLSLTLVLLVLLFCVVVVLLIVLVPSRRCYVVVGDVVADTGAVG